VQSHALNAAQAIHASRAIWRDIALTSDSIASRRNVDVLRAFFGTACAFRLAQSQRRLPAEAPSHLDENRLVGMGDSMRTVPAPSLLV